MERALYYKDNLISKAKPSHIPSLPFPVILVCLVNGLYVPIYCLHQGEKTLAKCLLLFKTILTVKTFFTICFGKFQ